jgi:hypothetical protein
MISNILSSAACSHAPPLFEHVARIAIAADPRAFVFEPVQTPVHPATPFQGEK